VLLSFSEFIANALRAKPLVAGLLFIVSLAAQDTTGMNSLETEILNYSEARSVLIANARNMIIDDVKTGNFTRVDSVISLVDQKLVSTNSVWLAWPERVLLRFIRIDPDLIRDPATLSTYFDFRDIDPDRKYLIPKDELFYELQLYVKEHEKQILDGYIRATNDPEVIEFVRLFMKQILYRFHHDLDEINIGSNAFLRSWPDSPYRLLVSRYIRYQYRPTYWGFGIGMVFGQGQYDRSLARYFPSHQTFGIMFELYFHRIALNTVMQFGGSFHPRKDFETNGNVWEKSAKYNQALFSVEMGYIWQMPGITITPYIGLAGQQFAKVREKKEGADDGFGTPLAIGYDVGINLDIPILPATSRFGSLGQPPRQIVLRLRAGRSDARHEQKVHPTFTGGLTYLQVGFGITGWWWQRDM